MENRLCGIFSISGISNSEKIKIIHEQNIILEKHEHIEDTLLDQSNLIKNHRVFGRMYKCNISDSYLMSTKKLPIMYISVIYEKPLRNFQLFRVYLCFTIDKDIKKIKELLDEEIEGKFTIELDIDGQRKVIDEIKAYPTDKNIKNKLNKFVQNKDMLEMIESMIGDVNKKLEEEFSKDFEGYEPPKHFISLKNMIIDD